MRGRHQPRPLVLGPHRHPCPRLRGRLGGALVRGQLHRLRSRSPEAPRGGCRATASDQVQAAGPRSMSAKTIRRIAVLVCAGGIAGMIGSWILNHNGTAITFGLITATAVLCSMVATAVAADAARTAAGPRPSSAGRGGGGQAMAVESDRRGALGPG